MADEIKETKEAPDKKAAAAGAPAAAGAAGAPAPAPRRKKVRRNVPEGVAQIAHPRVRADAGLREDANRVAGADAEDVRKRVLDFFVARQIHACDTSHASP